MDALCGAHADRVLVCVEISIVAPRSALLYTRAAVDHQDGPQVLILIEVYHRPICTL